MFRNILRILEAAILCLFCYAQYNACSSTCNILHTKTTPGEAANPTFPPASCPRRTAPSVDQERGSAAPFGRPPSRYEQRGPYFRGPAVILAHVSTNQSCDCLRINCQKVHESTVSEGRCYCTVSIIPKIGRYIATIMPPTITPRNRIISGSSMESRPDTATSTSSS